MELDLLPKTSPPKRIYLIIQMLFKRNYSISRDTNCGDLKPLWHQD